MTNKPRYLNYKGVALTKGSCFSMELGSDYVLSGSDSGEHVYIPRVFDSGDGQGTWQSFRLEAEVEHGKLEVVIAASDEDYREALESSELELKDKLELIRRLPGIRRVNTTDFLLTQLRGRYLYSYWRVSGREGCRFRIRGGSAEFPQNTFLQYFPEVYQTKDDFFQRYISIFQTMFLDLEREVDSLPARLDYEKAGKEDLLQLAHWIGLDEIILRESMRKGETDRLRNVIAHAQEIQSGKGTKQALQLVMDLLYEERIYLLEHFKWYENLEHRREELALYRRLYGKNESSLTILVEEREGYEFSDGEKKNMQRVAVSMMPIGMGCHLIFLKKNSHMDTHCYLDHNSVLASPSIAAADGMELYGNVVLQ